MYFNPQHEEFQPPEPCGAYSNAFTSAFKEIGDPAGCWIFLNPENPRAWKDAASTRSPAIRSQADVISITSWLPER